MAGVLEGLQLLSDPTSWAVLLCGLLLGFIIGLLPGFNASTGAALVLAFSLKLETGDALLLMAALYAGDTFSGAVPAILMNVPGTTGAAATALDGYPMAQAGEPGRAIGLARMASVFGGLLATGVVIIIIGPVAGVALLFGARELFVIAILGLLVIGTVIGGSVIKGVLAGATGMLVATVGSDPITAAPRMTLGMLELYDGIPVLTVIVGVFAVTQMLKIARFESLMPIDAHAIHDGTAEDVVGTTRVARFNAAAKRDLHEVADGVKETTRHPLVIARSTLIGGAIGIIPGTGTAVANFISYGVAKRMSKRPELFGKGSPEGIIASEAADNAVTAGTLVPTFALGIPGSGTAAVMLAALYLHGVTPGPQVMVTNRPEVYLVLLGLFFASLLILPFGVLLATPMTYITRLKPGLLAPPVLVLCLVGAMAVRNTQFDVGLVVFFGLIGALMTFAGYSVVPLVLGVILGPLAEENFSRALLLGDGELIYFFQSPAAIILWSVFVVVLLLGIRKSRTASRSRLRAGATGVQ